MTLTASTSLDDLLRRCVRDGVITPEQAARVLDYADLPATPAPRRSALVIEALGYVGGAIVLAGSVLVGAQYWGDLETTWQLVVLAGTALALLTAGAVIPSRSGALGVRLRAVLWLASTPAVSGFLAVLGDQGLDLGDRGLPLLIASGTAAYATALWAAHRNVLQQAAMMVALAVAAATGLHRFFEAESLPGLGAWVVGVIWFSLGRAELLRPRRVVQVLGAATMIVGGMSTASSDAGMVLTLITVAAVVTVSVVVRDLPLLAVGALGALVNVPAGMSRWFPDSVVAAFALVVVGIVLVAIAVSMAVRGGRDGPRRSSSTG